MSTGNHVPLGVPDVMHHNMSSFGIRRFGIGVQVEVPPATHEARTVQVVGRVLNHHAILISFSFCSPSPPRPVHRVTAQRKSNTQHHAQTLGHHCACTVKDRKVEDRATNSEVHGESHKGMSRKVKTGHVGKLRVTLDFQQHCDMLPETLAMAEFLSRMIHQYKVRSMLLERISFAFIVASSDRLLILGGAARFRGTR